MIPDLGGCGRLSSVRIELYSPGPTGGAHGVLAATAYSCGPDVGQMTARIRAAGLTAYVVPGVIGTPHRCGDGFDYTGPVALPIHAPEVAPGTAVAVLLAGAGASVRQTETVDGLDEGTRATNQPPASRARAYELVRAGMSAGLPVPMRVEAFTNRVLEVRFDPGDRASVDRWTAYLGLRTARVRKAFEDYQGRPSALYRSRLSQYDRLPGWSVAVGCRVALPTDQKGWAPTPSLSRGEHPEWCVQGPLCAEDQVHAGAPVRVNLDRGAEHTGLRVWLERMHDDPTDAAGTPDPVIILEATEEGEVVDYSMPLGQASLLAQHLTALVVTAGGAG